MKHLIVPIIAVLWSVTPAQSAEITVSPGAFGSTLIRINGRIFLGDENVFAAKTKSIKDSANTIVWLTSDGGSFVAARAIAQIVRDRGYSTLVLPLHQLRIRGNSRLVLCSKSAQCSSRCLRISVRHPPSVGQTPSCRPCASATSPSESGE